MAVHSIRSNISKKLKEFGQSQKESIKTSLYQKGELPIYLQILGAMIFWLLIFLILIIFISPNLKWLGLVIALIGAFLIVQGFNLLGRKFVRRDEEKEEEVANPTALEQSQRSILLGEHYKKGGIVLVENRKGKLVILPMLLLQIISVSSNSGSIFAALSQGSLNRLSLKYNCSIIDTSKYEAILLKGEPLKCKPDTLSLTVGLLDDSFFNGAFEIVSDLQRDKRIELEYPSENILKEIFPSFPNHVDLLKSTNESSKRESLVGESLSTELENEARELYETFTNVNQTAADDLQEDITLKIEKKEVKKLEKVKKTEHKSEDTNINSKQQLIVKDVLLRELNFSLDGFLSAAKSYYKKGIENILDKKYEVDTEKFLKLTHLFCDKEDIPFFYGSYSYLLKIIEFLDVELPSSADIENFSTRLAKEYVTITISDEHKGKLIEFLDAKLPRTNNSRSEKDFEDKSKLASIPPPPGKSQYNSTLEEEDS